MNDQPTIKLSLLQNGYSFIEESLEKAIEAEQNSHKWKFAVLNLIQAIELFLKEALRREHYTLVYSNVDKLSNTVTLNQAISRLSKISGVEILESDLKAVAVAKKWRDSIVHHEFEISEKESILLFGKLLGFVTYFIKRNLDETLDAEINGSVWKKAIEVFDYSAELYDRAKQLFDDEEIDEGLIWDCRSCGWDAFVIQDDINSCYVCGHTDSILECPDCNVSVYQDETRELQTGDEQYEQFCFSCADKREYLESEYYENIIMEEYYRRKYDR